MKCKDCGSEVETERHGRIFLCHVVIVSAISAIMALAVHHLGSHLPTLPPVMVEARVEKMEHLENNRTVLALTAQNRCFVVSIRDWYKAVPTLLSVGDRVRYKSDSVPKGSGPHEFDDISWLEKIPQKE